jgi:hypothetical protein
MSEETHGIKMKTNSGGNVKMTVESLKPIDMDKNNLTLMGVPFPDATTLERVANAIVSNMYEGFEPTADRIALIRDYVTDKITFSQFVRAVKEAEYAG